MSALDSSDTGDGGGRSGGIDFIFIRCGEGAGVTDVVGGRATVLVTGGIGDGAGIGDVWISSRHSGGGKGAVSTTGTVAVLRSAVARWRVRVEMFSPEPDSTTLPMVMEGSVASAGDVLSGVSDGAGGGGDITGDGEVTGVGQTAVRVNSWRIWQPGEVVAAVVQE